MNIHEHQAKAVLAEFGVAVPKGFAAFNTPYEDITVNSYLVWDARAKVAAAFDTGATCQAMLDVIHTEGLTLRYIFVTHTHEDHVADLPRLAAETKAEIWASTPGLSATVRRM